MSDSTDEVEFTYGLRVVGTDFYKIGWSTQPEVRCQFFDAWTPMGVEIAFTIPCPGNWWAMAVESFLQYLFRSKRLRKEWFSLSERDIDTVTDQVFPMYLDFMATWSEPKCYCRTRCRVDDMILFAEEYGINMNNSADESALLMARISTRTNRKHRAPSEEALKDLKLRYVDHYESVGK